MRPTWMSVAAGALAVSPMLLAPASAQDAAKAQLTDAQGETVGTVDLTETPNGVLLRLELTGGPPGEHAFHVHETGQCDPPDFESAGGHFNPDDQQHGLRNSDGPHAGDMPNLHVPDSGELTVEILNTTVTLEKGAPDSLLQEGGTALVIHEGVDDYETDPTGEAGGRLACGVIE